MAGIEPRRQDPSSASAAPMFAALTAVGGVVMALPAAEVAARALVGGGVVWPASPFLTAWGVLCGTPGMGYSDLFITGPAPVLSVPPRWLVITLAIVFEALVITVLTYAVRRWPSLISPGASGSGFATTAQARDVLGESVVYRRRREIRPDLYAARGGATFWNTLFERSRR